MAFVVTLAVLTVLSVIIDGVTLVVLYGWLIEPFTGIPMSLGLAASVTLVVGLLTKQAQKEDAVDKSRVQIVGELMAYMITKPVVFLGTGFAIKVIFF